ncbi:MAG: hypothetical protein ABSE56_12505 [Bryobacteraceae bacterium]|jgi:hypothetical protein
MTKRVYRLIALVLLSLPAVVLGQEFRRYRGTKVDRAATEQAQRAAATDPGLEVTVYVTADSFDKVYVFYKSFAREYNMLGKRVRKLPTGQELRDAFFLLDDAKDLVNSKMWVKIQRPYIGAGLARGASVAETRDVTAIVVSQRK